jgi:hypothetical protein
MWGRYDPADSVPGSRFNIFRLQKAINLKTLTKRTAVEADQAMDCPLTEETSSTTESYNLKDGTSDHIQPGFCSSIWCVIAFPVSNGKWPLIPPLRSYNPSSNRCRRHFRSREQELWKNRVITRHLVAKPRATKVQIEADLVNALLGNAALSDEDEGLD